MRTKDAVGTRKTKHDRAQVDLLIVQRANVPPVPKSPPPAFDDVAPKPVFWVCPKPRKCQKAQVSLMVP